MRGKVDADTIGKIRLLVLDVDGVLTDGRIIYGDDGSEFKTFDVKDGAGLKYWSRAGALSAIITGRTSPLVERRAKELGIDELRMDQKTKLPAFAEVLAKLGVSAEETAYIGDDLPDLPPMRRCAVSIAVADAVAEVRDGAQLVTDSKGGRGAVREAIEYLLKAQGKWAGILARYE